MPSDFIKWLTGETAKLRGQNTRLKTDLEKYQKEALEIKEQLRGVTIALQACQSELELLRCEHKDLKERDGWKEAEEIRSTVRAELDVLRTDWHAAGHRAFVAEQALAEAKKELNKLKAERDLAVTPTQSEEEMRSLVPPRERPKTVLAVGTGKRRLKTTSKGVYHHVSGSM